MFTDHLPTPEEVIAEEIIRQVTKSYQHFVSQTGQEPNVVFLSGFHMTAVVRGLRRDNEHRHNATVVAGPTILGLPVVVADVTPSVGYMVGDNRFKVLPRGRHHVIVEAEVQRRRNEVAALLQPKDSETLKKKAHFFQSDLKNLLEDK